MNEKNRRAWPPTVCQPRRPARIAVVLGTRPEAIKMAPVVLAMRRSRDLECTLVSTGQHREMLQQVFTQFGLKPDVELGLMTPDQTLNGLTRRLLEALDRTFEEIRPDLCVVQGDTTTAFAASLAAFYRRIPVGHVEAGLRSDDMGHPFPEEGNRRLTSVLADIHFAPTPLARERLLQENVPAERIVVTGNPVVDALTYLATRSPAPLLGKLLGTAFTDNRVVLVTSHRRESWGEGLENICHAVRDLAERFPDVHFVYPVHLNPRVRETAESILAGRERIHLVDPLGYLGFIQLMKRSHLILTDSGGIQEEAPTFGKPLLLLRKVTERPEAFMAGAAKIVGSDRQAIVDEASRLLSDDAAYRAMVSAGNPYGDGWAAERIVKAVDRWYRQATPWLADSHQFHPRFSEQHRGEEQRERAA